MITVRQPSLPKVIASHAKWRPQAKAIVTAEQAVTYRELQTRVDAVAGGLLAGGLAPGDRVCAVLGNGIALVEVILGTIQAGGVVAPLSPLAAPAALESMIARASPNVIFADPELVRGVAPQVPSLIAVGSAEPPSGWERYETWLAEATPQPPLPAYDLSAPVSVLFTSGTTGNPKGMVHSHFARLCYPLGLGSVMGIGHRSRAILVTPMYHNGTWTTMLPALYAGGSVVIPPKFEPRGFAELVERQQCTHAFMVPTQLAMLVEDPGFDAERLRTMEVIMCSGQPLFSHTLADIERSLPLLRFCEMYGMGEGFMTYADAHDYAEGKRGSVGLPIAIVDTDIAIIDDEDRAVAAHAIGEIVGTSALLMDGYLSDPESTRSAIWRSDCGREYVRSGDLGYLDEDGYLFIVGRKKDVIITGGIKVHSLEIENIFGEHPAVAEAIAIGIPHPKWGETPLLLAIPRPGIEATEEEVRAWGNARLGKTDRVARVEFRQEFPRNALQKVLRRELRAPYWVGRERDI